jgi:hydroxysqualene dehydroxylase
LLELPRDQIAQMIWQDVQRVAEISAALPPWQLVRERRATFAATPAQNARRPGAATTWRNLVLAGDWTATGLPATIESAVRSGNRAADLVLQGRP